MKTLDGSFPIDSTIAAEKPNAFGSADWMDVWSRSGAKYRIRAVVMLCVNVILFCGVGMFAFWMRSGRVLAPTTDGYWEHFAETFRFTGKSGVTLGMFLLQPISVQDVPVQILILGLLMATLIGIPILASILYRFWTCIPFIAIVGLVAVMPWLAITLLASCIIASVKPFRTPFRFVSALLGLIPAVVYLFLASAGTGDVVAGRIDPVDSIKFVAPWILAVVSAAILFAVVLTLAKIVDYRTGAITPLLALMFGLPVILFEFQVGRDELHFRLLEALHRAHFEDVDASAELESAAAIVWERLPLPKPSWSVVYQVEEEKWQMALAADLAPFRSELDRHKEELIARCELFRKHFSGSRHIMNVLYIQGRALDMRVDVGEFRRCKWIRFYDDFPSERSRLNWQTIVENAPNSIFAAPALLRLSQLDARNCDIDRADSKLTAMLDRFGPLLGQEEFDRGSLDADELGAMYPSLAKLLLEARRLRDLIRENRDPVFDDQPICGTATKKTSPELGLLDLDPRDENYLRDLEALRQKHPRSRLDDNLRLEIARTTEDITARSALLRALVDDPIANDAVPEALFRSIEVLHQLGRYDEVDLAYARLVGRHPVSIWAQQATRIFEINVAPSIGGAGA